MKSKGSSPTVKQKKYWDWMASKGCAVCGNNPEIHHVKGAKYSLKIDGIKTQVGNDYALPLCAYHHRNSDYQNNVTDWKNRFEDVHGKQIEMATQLFEQYIEENQGEPPFDFDILKALQIDSRFNVNDTTNE